jgi:hypothetical protein
MQAKRDLLSASLSSAQSPQLNFRRLFSFAPHICFDSLDVERSGVNESIFQKY